MKTTRVERCDEGSVVIAAMILVLVCFIVVASWLRFSANDARLTRIALDEQKASMVAEAGLDYGVMKLKDVLMQYQFSPTISSNSLVSMLNAIPAPPPIGAYVYQTPSGISAFRIRVESSKQFGVITNGMTCRGQDGTFQTFSVTCGAYNTNTHAGAVVKQMVQAVGLCLIRFGVFYERDLEILPGAKMDFYGAVHANGNLYLGGPLWFHDKLTAHGDVHARRLDTGARYDIASILTPTNTWETMKKADGTYLDSENANWMAESIARWGGQMMSGSHGVADLSPPIDPLDEPHDIIERPLATNNPAYRQGTEDEKFSNKACLRIYVASNGTVRATDWYTNDISSSFSNVDLEISGTNATTLKPEYAKNTANGAYYFSTNSPAQGVYDVTQTNFYDHHENTWMRPVDLYLDQLQACFTNLYKGTKYPIECGKGIVYVTRDDPDGASNGVVPCVRIRNGATIIPANGLSIVSDLPVYIEGDFNTTNSFNTNMPMLVAGDAVTLLSKQWQDALSKPTASDDDKSKRVPITTTYNTVIMTGNKETVANGGTPGYNGGLENVLRFLEDWADSADKTVKYRGSIIDLWFSELQRQTVDGTYYTPPRRNWGYDDIYRTQAPPGMTKVYGMEELFWSRSSWGHESW